MLPFLCRLIEAAKGKLMLSKKTPPNKDVGIKGVV
jgi:hypothetical protein